LDVPLDAFTLLISTSATLVFIGCALLYFWYRDRRSTWLCWWGVPFVVGGLAALTYVRPNWDSDFFTIAVGNAARIGALAMLWHGAQVFHRKRPTLWVTALIVAVWVGGCLIPEFLQSMAWRVAAVSVANALVCGLAAWELWLGRNEKLPSRAPAIGVLLSFSVLMAARVVGVGFLPFPMGAGPLDPLWLAGFNLAIFVHATFLGLLLIAMTKERLELQQRNIALVDPLTGLMNRRAFMTQVERNARRRATGREATSFLVLDLDHFKSINDRHGHEIGDRVLALFATTSEANVRATDQLYRMGGEEFCFVLPDTEVQDAIIVAERIRREFATSAVETPGGERILATVSIGIATAEFAGFDYEVLLAAADAALYEAKARGRNRVIVTAPAALEKPADSGKVEPLRRRA
jgi:diguanylate cyclase (GGDEF)-like protein